jgi:hypothetical protein
MLMNFYFTCDAPPADNTATMELFKPGNVGTPNSLSLTVAAPSGNFLPAVQNLSCTIGATTNPSVDLSWTNGDSYTAITVRRDGAVLAVLGGTDTSYSDTTASYGPSTYTVQAEQAAVPAAAIACDVIITPLPQSGFSCAQPDPESNAVQLSWINGMVYDSITVTRNGTQIASLSGTDTGYLDLAASISTHLYELNATVSGFDTGIESCNITVLPPPPLGFTFTAPDADAGYDPTTGAGDFNVVLSGIESNTNNNYPNQVTGYSLAMVFDAALMTAVGIDESVVPAALDFFDGQFGAGFITAGAVVDFSGNTSLSLQDSTPLTEVAFSTNPGGLINQTNPIVTPLVWQNGVVGGSLPVDNLIVVGSAPMPPGFSNGQVTLTPGAGVTFVRGDINDDSAINIADAVTGLAYLFSGGSASCIDAIDTNDDGQANVADGVYLLAFLFSAGQAPPGPNPDCGSDPTSDSLECETFTSCP